MHFLLDLSVILLTSHAIFLIRQVDVCLSELAIRFLNLPQFVSELVDFNVELSFLFDELVLLSLIKLMIFLEFTIADLEFTMTLL